MRTARLGLIIATLFAGSAAYAGAPGWTISESSGKVAVVSTGVVKVAVRGGALTTGDFVTTGANGRAVLVRGEEYLVVAPNSRIRVADPAKSGGMTQIIEHFGNVIYKIKKMAMPHFAVETPFLAAVVKGTTFSVTVTEKGASVQVVEGRVEVATRDGGASYMVLPGDIGSVSAGAPASLNVQGRETRTIQSTIPAAEAPKVEPVAASLGEEAEDSQPAVTVIAEAVGEGPVRLDAVSGGMVKGDSSLLAMVAVATTSAPQPAAVAETVVESVIDTVTALPPAPAVAAPTPAPVATPGTMPAPAPAVTPAVVVASTPAPVVTPAVVVTPIPGTMPTPAPVVTPAPLPPVVVAVAPTPAPVVPGSSPGSNNGSGSNNSGSGSNSGSGNGNGNNGNGNGNGGPNGNYSGGSSNASNGKIGMGIDDILHAND
jgi:FecR protein